MPGIFNGIMSGGFDSREDRKIMSIAGYVFWANKLSPHLR